MAADKNTPKEPQGGQFDREVSSLLDFLQTPIKQVQEWVSSGQLQTTIENLQEKAERAQEGVERRLRALDEVRQGVQSHVRKQMDAYQQQSQQRSAEPAPPVTAKASSRPRPKAKSSGKKPRGKKSSSGRKS
ncbi:MAG TPA: hypothetical protein VHH54_07010 [Actinomycetota bacterium]|nr:hypothetical protein [Actinomycetota bacterium]